MILLDSLDNPLNSSLIKNRRFILGDSPGQVASVDNDMVFYMDFQICSIVEYHNGNKRNIHSTFKQITKKPYMPFILLNGIIKLMPAFIDYLRPIFRVFSSQYPAFITLCLNNKHSIGRYNDMVYLCRTTIAFK